MVSPNAHATAGIYLDGYGIHAAGMGGTSVAFPQDVLVTESNPAGMALLGTRFDEDFQAIIGRVHTTFASPENHLTASPIAPALEGGFNWQVAPKWTLGVGVDGAGFASNYGQTLLPNTKAGVAKASFTAFNVLPTVTYRPIPSLSLGLSMVLSWEQFRANGLVASGPDGAPIAIPSHGNSSAFGIGFGTGLLWQPIPLVSFGAAYYSKVNYGRLSGYSDDILAAYGGRIDQPSRLNVGIAVHVTPSVTLAVDGSRIYWSSVAVFSDPATYGWKVQNVLGVGLSWDVNSKWTLRLGAHATSNQFGTDNTVANILGPAVILRRSVSAGVSYRVTPKDEVSAAFTYVIPKTVVGTGPSAGTSIKANMQYLGIGYSHNF
ncbi:OmpP1/FadL family transporter [Paraburkholderia sediminicola]|nr:outer membrane protein transport protein [Paraburkholderia sediminicola]